MSARHGHRPEYDEVVASSPCAAFYKGMIFCCSRWGCCFVKNGCSSSGGLPRENESKLEFVSKGRSGLERVRCETQTSKEVKHDGIIDQEQLALAQTPRKGPCHSQKDMQRPTRELQ